MELAIDGDLVLGVLPCINVQLLSNASEEIFPGFDFLPGFSSSEAFECSMTLTVVSFSGTRLLRV